MAAGYVRDELLAIDLMRPKEELLAVSYKSLSNSDIESLIHSQKTNEHQHLLVVDEETMCIRGVATSGKPAANTALPQPPNTSQNVPKAEAKEKTSEN